MAIKSRTAITGTCDCSDGGTDLGSMKIWLSMPSSGKVLAQKAVSNAEGDNDNAFNDDDYYYFHYHYHRGSYLAFGL